MSKWKVKIGDREEEFKDVREKKLFLKREFVPVIVGFVRENEQYSMEPDSIKGVTSPEGEDVSNFAHYVIIYQKKDGAEVKILFALMEDESSQLVGVSNGDVHLETILEALFTPENIEKLVLYY